MIWRQVWDYEFIAKALIENYNSDVTVMTDSLLNNITVSDRDLLHLSTIHMYQAWKFTDTLGSPTLIS